MPSRTPPIFTRAAVLHAMLLAAACVPWSPGAQATGTSDGGKLTKADAGRAATPAAAPPMGRDVPASAATPAEPASAAARPHPRAQPERAAPGAAKKAANRVDGGPRWARAGRGTRGQG